MKLRILGCNSPYPAIDGACSGYLIRDDDTSVLIDCGHSVFSKLIKEIDIANLDAIIITHFHPDHYVDLYAIRHYIKLSGAKDKLISLYIPSEPREMFNYWNDISEFKVIPLRDNTSYEVNSLKINAYQMLHPILTYGIAIKSDISSLFYTADTAYDENLKIPANVKVLLGEATFLSDEAHIAKETGHMSTNDLVMMANKVKPELLIASHYWPGYALIDIEKEIGEKYAGKFILAENGKEINI